MKKCALGLFMIILLGSCSQKHTYTESVIDETNLQTNSGVAVGYPKVLPVKPSERKPVAYLPNATVFRMSGNYSHNVAITIGENGNLSYFPAPSDITADSEPISLGDGWWLNCQGLGPNSVFTKYTFAEYAELTEVPSPSQLKKDIIPGARVTEFKELPIKLTEAMRNPESVKPYLK